MPAESYVLLNDKLVSSDVSLVEWCPTMDLLALATSENHISPFLTSPPLSLPSPFLPLPFPMYHFFNLSSFLNFGVSNYFLLLLQHIWIYRFLAWLRLLVITGDGRVISSMVWHPDGTKE
jgi:hypothetical protein